jgi:ECF sigma factor
MSDVTRILSQIETGDPAAAEKLLPLVYEELRKLAAAKLAQERPGQTLQATALVHEAYLRLVGGGGARDSGLGANEQGTANRGQDKGPRTEEPKNQPGTEATVPQWNSRGHFFAAAAEAMRRILVERGQLSQYLHNHAASRKKIPRFRTVLPDFSPAFSRRSQLVIGTGRDCALGVCAINGTQVPSRAAQLWLNMSAERELQNP